MCISDPPYGVEYDGSFRAVADGSNNHRTGTFQDT